MTTPLNHPAPNKKPLDERSRGIEKRRKDDTERLKRERNEKYKQSIKTNGTLAGTIANDRPSQTRPPPEYSSGSSDSDIELASNPVAAPVATLLSVSRSVDATCRSVNSTSRDANFSLLSESSTINSTGPEALTDLSPTHMYAIANESFARSEPLPPTQSTRHMNVQKLPTLSSPSRLTAEEKGKGRETLAPSVPFWEQKGTTKYFSKAAVKKRPEPAFLNKMAPVKKESNLPPKSGKPTKEIVERLRQEDEQEKEKQRKLASKSALSPTKRQTSTTSISTTSGAHRIAQASAPAFSVQKVAAALDSSNPLTDIATNTNEGEDFIASSTRVSNGDHALEGSNSAVQEAIFNSLTDECNLPQTWGAHQPAGEQSSQAANSAESLQSGPLQQAEHCDVQPRSELSNTRTEQTVPSQVLQVTVAPNHRSSTTEVGRLPPLLDTIPESSQTSRLDDARDIVSGVSKAHTSSEPATVQASRLEVVARGLSPQEEPAHGAVDQPTTRSGPVGTQESFVNTISNANTHVPVVPNTLPMQDSDAPKAEMPPLASSTLLSPPIRLASVEQRHFHPQPVYTERALQTQYQQILGDFGGAENAAASSTIPGSHLPDSAPGVSTSSATYPATGYNLMPIREPADAGVDDIPMDDGRAEDSMKPVLQNPGPLDNDVEMGDDEPAATSDVRAAENLEMAMADECMDEDVPDGAMEDGGNQDMEGVELGNSASEGVSSRQGVGSNPAASHMPDATAVEERSPGQADFSDESRNLLPVPTSSVPQTQIVSELATSMTLVPESQNLPSLEQRPTTTDGRLSPLSQSSAQGFVPDQTPVHPVALVEPTQQASSSRLAPGSTSPQAQASPTPAPLASPLAQFSPLASLPPLDLGDDSSTLASHMQSSADAFNQISHAPSSEPASGMPHQQYQQPPLYSPPVAESSSLTPMPAQSSLPLQPESAPSTPVTPQTHALPSSTNTTPDSKISQADTQPTSVEGAGTPEKLELNAQEDASVEPWVNTTNLGSGTTSGLQGGDLTSEQAESSRNAVEAAKSALWLLDERSNGLEQMMKESRAEEEDEEANGEEEQRKKEEEQTREDEKVVDWNPAQPEVGDEPEFEKFVKMLAELSFRDESQTSTARPQPITPKGLLPSIEESADAPSQVSTPLPPPSPKSVKSDASSRSATKKGKTPQRKPSPRATSISSTSQPAREAELVPPSSIPPEVPTSRPTGEYQQTPPPTEEAPFPITATTSEHGPDEGRQEDDSANTIRILFAGVDEFIDEADNLEKVNDATRAEWDAKLQSGRHQEVPTVGDVAGADAVNGAADPTSTSKTKASIGSSGNSASGEKASVHQGPEPCWCHGRDEGTWRRERAELLEQFERQERRRQRRAASYPPRAWPAKPTKRREPRVPPIQVNSLYDERACRHPWSHSVAIPSPSTVLAAVPYVMGSIAGATIRHLGGYLGFI